MKEIFQLQEEELSKLQQRSERLRRKYDQYFLGMEKREPGFEREQLDRDLRKSKLNRTLSTGLRFKYQQFLARHRTYSAYWDRVIREIEEGTYRRGSVTPAERLAKRQAEDAVSRAQGLDPETGRPVEVDRDGVAADEGSIEERRIRKAANEAQRYLSRLLGPGQPATPVAAAPPPVPAAPPASPKPQGGIRGLYTRYVDARKERGEDVSKITYSRFERSVKKQEAAAREKLGVEVELRLKVTERKVSLVASRKRKSTDQ